MTFDNSYARLPERFFARFEPLPVPAPKLLAWNEQLAGELGLSGLAEDDAQRGQVFSGNVIPDGADPISLAYAGHQFGQFVPRLGDGRAVLLGEVVDEHGVRRDIQLKGSGRTPFSRGGDGKSSLGPVIREYILSEAMHALGVPTTRALAAVLTGEQVYRELPLPGGVLTRVASSHIRIGTFEYFAARGDVEGLKILADFAIQRHGPQLVEGERPYLAFFAGVVERQAELVAHWMDIGFIHGVMNTDNTTVSGETLDYGPCAFMDEFHAAKVFSSIDHGGRYAYDRQPAILHWNLTRLAECLLLLDDDQAKFEEQLARTIPHFEAHYYRRMRRKLGLIGNESGDEALIREWLQHLQSNELDYTQSFRELAKRTSEEGARQFGDFERKWLRRISIQESGPSAIAALMNSVNPLFIPRNHQVERAIKNAINGDAAVFHELREVLVKPFDEQPDYSHYAEPPSLDERVARTFCGT
jgi:uncharacterized protein YdiU (UPF0061 family)